MSVKTNLHGRLRNTPLPTSQGLMPLFEAVVNSIHSIEEFSEQNKVGIRDRSIIVEISRKVQTVADLENGESKRGISPQSEITGFKIIDNGIGFNDENFQSFETLDSEHKIAKGCRGVGRLLWLKAFDTVNITSSFNNGADVIKRTFSFDAHSGVNKPIDQNLSSAKIETIVTLSGFHKDYRKASPKTTNKIAESLLEHCL